jgi:hypothetical protein
MVSFGFRASRTRLRFRRHPGIYASGASRPRVLWRLHLWPEPRSRECLPPPDRPCPAVPGSRIGPRADPAAGQPCQDRGRSLHSAAVPRPRPFPLERPILDGSGGGIGLLSCACQEGRQGSGGVIARSGATKQSRGRPTALDCFASLAMTLVISSPTPSSFETPPAAAPQYEDQGFLSFTRSSCGSAPSPHREIEPPRPSGRSSGIAYLRPCRGSQP